MRHREELELSKDQMRSLEKIRDSSEKEAIKGMADLQDAMLDLRNLLQEDQIDLTKAGTLNKRIESIQAGLRQKNIEAFAQAKKVLTKEQLRKLRALSMISDRGHFGRMMRE